jgi:hypothetical protein
VDGDEPFAEGIVAEGDGFRVAHFGNVHVDGEASSCLVDIGADGVVVNSGVLDTEFFDSSVIAADGGASRRSTPGWSTWAANRTPPCSSWAKTPSGRTAASTAR